MESMLRADPPAVGSIALARRQAEQKEAVRQTSPFPSGAFNFSFTGYEGLFDLANANVSGTDFASAFPNDEKDLHGQDSVPFPASSRSSISVPYSPESPNTGASEGLSASAQVTPNAVADNFANAAQAGLGGGIDEAGIPYNQLMGLMYPNYDPSAGFATQPYTHVDPTQLLGVDREGQSFAHASPSSDGWGFNSSSTASPEPLVASSASTPPSAESGSSAAVPGRNVTGRKISNPRRLSQDSTGTGRTGGVLSPLTPIQSKKKSSLSNSAVVNAARQAAPRSSASPDQGQSGTANSNAGASTDDADSVPTVCTNCQTTNTPLWRRDPEGQPLCEFVRLLSFGRFL